MQMIHDAISPERLELFKKIELEASPEDRVETLKESIRTKRERQSEAADRASFASRHERRKAAALAR